MLVLPPGALDTYFTSATGKQELTEIRVQDKSTVLSYQHLFPQSQHAVCVVTFACTLWEEAAAPQDNLISTKGQTAWRPAADATSEPCYSRPSCGCCNTKPQHHPKQLEAAWPAVVVAILVHLNSVSGSEPFKQAVSIMHTTHLKTV